MGLDKKIIYVLIDYLGFANYPFHRYKSGFPKERGNVPLGSVILKSYSYFFSCIINGKDIHSSVHCKGCEVLFIVTVHCKVEEKPNCFMNYGVKQWKNCPWPTFQQSDDDRMPKISCSNSVQGWCCLMLPWLK